MLKDDDAAVTAIRQREDRMSSSTSGSGWAVVVMVSL